MFRTLLLWFALMLTALLGRELALHQQIKTALSIFKIQNPDRNPEHLKILTLNSLRGDFKVEYPTPPFQPLAWTVNINTREVIPWQSDLRTSFQK